MVNKKHFLLVLWLFLFPFMWSMILLLLDTKLLQQGNGYFWIVYVGVLAVTVLLTVVVSRVTQNRKRQED